MNSGIDKTRNSGIDCLKVLMCFVVILCHCWDPRQSFCLSAKMLYPALDLAVPTFFLMSFILCGHLFSSTPNWMKISSRLKKLLIPHFFWAVTGFVILMTASAVAGNRGMRLSDLGWQLLGGHVYDRAMWFQVDLLLLTVLFFLSSIVSRNDELLYALAVIAFILEYTGANYEIFGGLRKEMRYTLGRIVEMTPYCATGIILTKKRIFESLGRNWIPYSLICGTIIVCHYLPVFNFSGDSFQYAGLDLYLTSLSIVILFWILPFNRLPNIVRDILKWMSGYTLGIYCMHSLIPEMGIVKGDLLKCFNIFIICMIVSYLISLIPCKGIKMAVK